MNVSLKELVKKVLEKLASPLRVESVSVTVTRTLGSYARITAPTVSGYTFVSWIHFATNGWVTPIYTDAPTSTTATVWVASDIYTSGTGTVVGFALYVKA